MANQIYYNGRLYGGQVDTVNGQTGTVVLDAGDVGALPASAVGSPGGVAALDATGKVPAVQLPSYVDDVEEYATLTTMPSEGETGKLYVALDSNLVYRWSGTQYIALSAGSGGLALGETSATAYRGDRGKIAYDHTQTTTGNPHHVTKADVGLGSVDNTTDAAKPVSTPQQTAINAAVADRVASTTILHVEAVAGLPGTPDTKTLYLVRKS